VPHHKSIVVLSTQGAQVVIVARESQVLYEGQMLLQAADEALFSCHHDSILNAALGLGKVPHNNIGLWTSHHITTHHKCIDKHV
jgi:hypothetical protein